MELEQYWQFGAALVFVLALIGILFFVIQRVGGGGGRGRRGSRLGLVEVSVVDKRRRLVLVRRDSVEHLIMIGGPQDVVVESRITKREPTFHTDGDSSSTGPALHERPGGAAAPLAAAAAEPRLSASYDDRPSQEERPAHAVRPSVEAPRPPPAAADPSLDTMPREDHPPQYRAPIPAAVIEPAHEEPRPAPHKAMPARQAAPAPTPAPSELDPPRMEAARPPTELEPDMERAPPPRDELHAAGPAEQPASVTPPPGSTAPDRPEPSQSRAGPVAPDQHPWPPSEGRFREAQRRFAERSEQAHVPRSSRDHDEKAYGPHDPTDRPAPVRAAAGQSAIEGHEPRHEEARSREPANLNVRPGEDR